MIRKCYSAFPKAQRIEPRIIRNRWGPNVTFFQFRSLRFSRRRRIRWRTASGSPFLYMGCRCFCLKTSVSTLNEGSKPFWPHIALFWTVLPCSYSLIALFHFCSGVLSKNQAFCLAGKHETGVKGHKIQSAVDWKQINSQSIVYYNAFFFSQKD